jgi:hypothetical protein
MSSRSEPDPPWELSTGSLPMDARTEQIGLDSVGETSVNGWSNQGDQPMEPATAAHPTANPMNAFADALTPKIAVSYLGSPPWARPGAVAGTTKGSPSRPSATRTSARPRPWGR